MDGSRTKPPRMESRLVPLISSDSVLVGIVADAVHDVNLDGIDLQA